MKKVLFLIVTLVCAVTGAWADTSVNLSDGTLTITTTEAGTLSSQTFTDVQKAATTIVLVGKFSSADLEAINRNHGFTSVTTVNMKNAVFNAATSNSHMIFSSEDARTSYNNHVADYAKSVVGSLYKSEYGKEIVFFLKQNGSWTKVDNLPEGATQKTPENWMTLSGFSNNDYSWWGANNDYVQLEQNNDELGWQLVSSFTEGETHDLEGRIYASTDAMEDPASADLYAVVGGSEKMYKSGSWGDVTEVYDWTQMAFGGWSGLETIILPDNFNVESGKNYNNFYGNNKSTLQRIERGDSYAIIGSSNGNYTADIYCADDDRANMKAIVGLDNFVTQDANITYANPNDHDYITWNETTQVYDVHVTSAGSLKGKYTKLLNEIGANALNGKVFRFDDQCKNFTAEDLQALAHANGPFVYVDLHNVDLTLEENVNIETAIEDAVKGNTEKGINRFATGQYYRGLLLPKNPKRIGTTLILNSGTSPVSEFIAYNSGSTTVAHIYDTQPTSGDYATKLTNLNTILNGHPEIATNTSVYLVSTNSKEVISNVESISSTATIVHTYNNEMVNANTTTEPTILVIPASPGDYATLNSATNIRNTPDTEVLKFSGEIDEDDILAVNHFTQATWSNVAGAYVQAVWSETEDKWVPAGENDEPVYNGPKVLDLSAVTGPADLIENLQSYLSELNNPEIQYIILPAGMEKPVVGDYANLENLKCVISTDVKSEEGDKVLTAYVREPGSLAEARTYATGEISSNNKVGLNKIKLYGNLRTEDIAKDNNGALYAESSIESIDLSDAVFVKIDADTSEPVVDASGYVVDEECSQMNFSTHKNSNLSEIFLPTDRRMKTIPADCFDQVDKLSEVCIPINYTRILSGAFTQTDVCHITTTDSNGNLVDMGENTYVLPENLTFIGEGSFKTKSKTVTDVYVQSTIPPVCEKDAFSTEMTWGDGGADFDAKNTNGVYCRDVFNNGGNAVAILHFPAQEGSGLSDAEYKAMAEKYTDITKVYTKKDQTGAVDANGNPITWPIESEFKRSYHQAENGVIWMDEGWVNSDGTIMQNSNPYTVIEEGSTNKLETCGFKDYVGWHQFVLCFASFMPTEDSDVREYVKDGWHTFCIPYDMTLKDVVELMGVPKSDGKIVNKIVDGENVTLVEDDDILPDIYTLEHVERQLITKTNQGNIHLALSESLVHEVGGKKMGRFPSYKDNANNVLRNGRENKGEVQVYEDNGYINGEPVILRAGYPYLIKPYIRNGESRPYLGQYVMTHHEFPQENSAIMMVDGEGESAVKTTRHHNHCWIDLIQSTDMTDPVKRVTSYDGDVMAALKGTEKDDDKRDKWSRFAIPYEGHRFKATILNENTGAVDGYDNDMVYSFHGNYWKQPLPLNCYYLNTKKATHKWYYYKNYSAAYVWHPYTCILGVGLDVKKDESTSDNLIDAYGSSNILNPIKWDANGNPVYKRKFQLGYTDEQDDSFEGMSHAREIRIVFDDAITEIGEDGEVVTAIETLDGKKLAPISGKVFNLRGQYVGDSVDGLPKGLYIVNGHKVVVD